MKSYYKLIDSIFGYLNGNESINTVTTGDIFEVDLSKHTIFPLAHIIVNEVAFEQHFMNFSLTILAMDIVDETKSDKQSTSSPHLGMDNKQDILNTMLSVINGLQSSLRRGGLESDGFELNESASATLFEDRMESLFTGWSLSLNVQVANNDIQIINSTGTGCL